MKLTAPADLYLVAIGDNVEKGDVVDVDDETGAALLAQGWTRGSGASRKTIDEVIAEVGDDPTLAVQALVVEDESSAPRKKLVAALNEIITAAPAADTED